MAGPSADIHPKRKVLYVNSSSELFGGAERSLVELVDHMAERGWLPEVVLPRSGPLVQQLRASGVRVHVIPNGSPKSRAELRSPILMIRAVQSLTGALRIAVIIRRSKIAVVHTNTSAVLAGALAARLTQKPHVWHVRELQRGLVWRLLRPLILRLSVRIICISGAVSRNLRAQDPRIVVLPNAVNEAFLNPELLDLALQEPGPVTMIGRINPWKGHRSFLQAAALVNRELPEVRFQLIGGCPDAHEDLYKDLLETRQKLGLNRSAKFIDHLPREELSRLLAAAQLVVLPSSAPEPFGLVVLEAMALGKAVIATDHGGPKEIISNGQTGLLIPPENPEAMSKAIIELIRKPTKRVELGRNARRLVLAKYSMGPYMDTMSALYGIVTGCMDAAKSPATGSVT